MDRIVVQKFGGTSVATEELRACVARHIERAISEGLRPVVVVSAMGRAGDPYATDTLLQLVQQAGERANGRDVDLLLSCGEVIATVVLSRFLTRRGHVARALTGAQAGLITDGRFGEARILRVEPRRVLEALAAGEIPVIAGFQGISQDGEVTTLGRGGSDTSAAALAVALSAEALEVYTDVDGIKTADPRLFPEAVTLERATYREVAELAHVGAKIIHPRAVEIAMKGKIPIRIRQTTSDAPGTLVCDDALLDPMEAEPEDRPVTGIAHIVDRCQAVVSPPAGDSSAAVQLFEALAAAGISADMIYVSPDRIAFIVAGNLEGRMKAVLQKLGWPHAVTGGLAKVSAVGAGMHGVPGVMAKIARALHQAGIEILQTTDSHANISCLIREEEVSKAVSALHREFALGKS